MIYLLIFLLLLFLSYHYDFCGRKRGRKAWYNAVLIMLILVAGLRWRLGSDTPVYLRQFYYETTPLWNLTIEDVLEGLKPFWKLLNSFVYTLFGRYYILQLIQASIVNVLFFKYFKKHSKYIFFCVLLYFFWLYFSLSMQLMKASFSIAICLFANDYLIEKKWIKSYSLYFLALMFHPQAALLLLMPFFLKLKFNISGILFLLFCFCAGFAIQQYLGDYLFIIEAVGDDTLMQKANRYADIVTKADNSFLRTITAVAIGLCEMFATIYAKKKAKLDIRNLEPFLILGMASIMIQINVELFYRYVYYFSFHFILMFSYIAQYIVHRSSQARTSKGLSFAKVMLFFLPLMTFVHANRYFQLARYVPYNSIIEMGIDEEREYHYMLDGKEPANKNEY